MSGGHYDYAYGRVRDLADAIYGDAEKHSQAYTDVYGNAFEAYPTDVLDAMRRCADALSAASDAAKDVEWFMSGDHGDEKFVELAAKWSIGTRGEA